MEAPHSRETLRELLRRRRALLSLLSHYSFDLARNTTSLISLITKQIPFFLPSLNTHHLFHEAHTCYTKHTLVSRSTCFTKHTLVSRSTCFTKHTLVSRSTCFRKHTLVSRRTSARSNVVGGPGSHSHRIAQRSARWFSLPNPLCLTLFV